MPSRCRRLEVVIALATGARRDGPDDVGTTAWRRMACAHGSLADARSRADQDLAVLGAGEEALERVGHPVEPDPGGDEGLGVEPTRAQQGRRGLELAAAVVDGEADLD